MSIVHVCILVNNLFSHVNIFYIYNGFSYVNEIVFIFIESRSTIEFFHNRTAFYFLTSNHTIESDDGDASCLSHASLMISSVNAP